MNSLLTYPLPSLPPSICILFVCKGMYFPFPYYSIYSCFGVSDWIGFRGLKLRLKFRLNIELFLVEFLALVVVIDLIPVADFFSFYKC